MTYKTKQIISKYKGITYPFFSINTKPYSITYDINTIRLQKYEDTHTETVDDKTLSGKYISRLLQLNNRITFDNTSNSLQELLFSKAKWGMDSNAIPFDLSNKENYPAKIHKIKRVIGNLIWLRNISYPFTLAMPTDVDIDRELYAVTILIHNEWYIKEFAYYPTLSRKCITV